MDAKEILKKVHCKLHCMVEELHCMLKDCEECVDDCEECVPDLSDVEYNKEGDVVSDPKGCFGPVK